MASAQAKEEAELIALLTQIALKVAQVALFLWLTAVRVDTIPNAVGHNFRQKFFSALRLLN